MNLSVWRMKRRLEDGTYKDTPSPHASLGDVEELQALPFALEPDLVLCPDPLLHVRESSKRGCSPFKIGPHAVSRMRMTIKSLWDHCDASYHLSCLDPPLPHIQRTCGSVLSAPHGLRGRTRDV
jgi:hypothetical protein